MFPVDFVCFFFLGFLSVRVPFSAWILTHILFEDTAACFRVDRRGPEGKWWKQGMARSGHKRTPTHFTRVACALSKNPINWNLSKRNRVLQATRQEEIAWKDSMRVTLARERWQPPMSCLFCGWVEYHLLGLRFRGTCRLLPLGKPLLTVRTFPRHIRTGKKPQLVQPILFPGHIRKGKLRMRKKKQKTKRKQTNKHSQPVLFPGQRTGKES